MAFRADGRAVVMACWLLAGLAAGPAPAARAEDPAPPDATATNLLVEKCLACHASDARKGGLDLTRRDTAERGGDSGPAVVPGRPDESLLMEKVAAGEMPPKGRLSPEQVEALRAWVAAGAPYPDGPLQPRRAGPDWWSLRPIRRPEVPAVSRPGWVRTPVDAFVLAKLDAAGLAPAPEADRRTHLRRVTFDLTGLPPTPEEAAAFEADSRPDAYERLVDRLLANPAHGERWGRHWLDVVRFAESHGYETNQLRPNAWPYRDWVIRAFNRDLPFAQFVMEQLAGDTLPEADGLARAATGFLVGGSHDVVGNLTPEGQAQQRADDLDDLITATGTAFLGLTVHCARCHDHKFDPIAQRDYYALQAVFAGVQHADREIALDDESGRVAERAAIVSELAALDRRLDEREPIARHDLGAVGRPPVGARRNVERIAPRPAKSVRFTVLATNTGSEPCLDELEVWTAGDDARNVALAAAGATAAASSTYPNSDLHRLEHIHDGRHGNARSWISAAPGKGWVRIDLAEPAVIDRIVWGRDREGAYTDRLPVEYTIEAAVAPDAWQVVASSADRAPFVKDAPAEGSKEADPLWARQAALRARLATLSGASRVYAGTFATPGPTRVLRRGDPMQPGEAVAPGGIAAVAPGLSLPADAPEPERRRALARWIADPANPLPARVLVNRLWHYHFGRGLVGTPSDFGYGGDRPSHPELLDWLAAEFLAGGGRLRPIHRQIVLSSAYRQSSRFDERAAAADAGNRLVWRASPRRLEAEAIRDAMLAAAGTLDRRMGGPGYWIWEPNTNYVVVFTPREDLGPEHERRMVYQYRPRSRLDPTFGAFDCPDGGLVAPRRETSTTALQALNLLNSRFVLAQASRFAERLAREAGPDPAAQVDRAFALAFGRAPEPDERAAAVALVRRHGASALARVLVNANEFVSVR
jgi:mono/diheme cytochrome c family protein